MGGGQIGYNWQVSPLWVVGLEADFQGALEKDNVILANNFTSTAVLSGAITGTRTVTGTAVEDFSTKIEWFGTARVRAGYVWGNGDVMSYLTGGLAYGKVDLEGTSTVTTNLSDVATILRQGVVARNFSHNDVNIGWVVGYGTEGRLALTNWTWKIEGLWMDLGTLDTPGVITGVTSPGNGFVVTTAGGPATMHTHFTDGILRAGLNYKFY
jgi:outer membrane immunogenic protein